MKLEEYIAMLEQIMGARFDNYTEWSNCILSHIRASPKESRVPLIEHLVKYWGMVPENNKFFPAEDIPRKRKDEILGENGRSFRRRYHLWLAGKPTEKEFAEKLSTYLEGCGDEDAQDVLFAILLQDGHLPYCKIPDEYKEVSQAEVALAERQEEWKSSPEQYLYATRDKLVLVRNIIRNYEPASAALLLWRVLEYTEDSAVRLEIFMRSQWVLCAAVEREVVNEMIGSARGVFPGMTAANLPPTLKRRKKRRSGPRNEQ